MRPDRPVTARPALASVQRALVCRLMGGAAGADAEALIAGDARASAADRLAVYAHMYRARLGEALASQFPRLATRLGPAAFDDLAAAYFADHPSRHWSLRFAGARLPDWLAARPDAEPALAGLARLEWARADVFDLADDALLTLDVARAWPPDRFGDLPLRLIAAARLITVAAGTAALWDAPEGNPIPLPGPASGAASLIVWREGTVVYHRVIDEDERAALALAVAGVSFASVCASLAARHTDDAAIARAYAWLTTWLSDGLLAAPSE